VMCEMFDNLMDKAVLHTSTMMGDWVTVLVFEWVVFFCWHITKKQVASQFLSCRSNWKVFA